MKLEELFKANEIKVTKGRIVIYNILFEAKEPISVESIYNNCKERGVKINLSTVYRSIEIFIEKSLVEKIPSTKGIFLYRLKRNVHKHILECDLCHKEVEVPCPIAQYENVVKNSTGFTLIHHDLKLKGLCSDCNKDD